MNQLDVHNEIDRITDSDPYRNVAVFVHTFLRDDLMDRCVASVRYYLPGARIYLSDGGRMTAEKEHFYEQLRSEGHWVKHYEEFNIWWRKVFNQKAAIATEQYILKLDDDFYFDDQSNVHRLLELMEEEQTLGLLGGRVYHKHRKEDSVYVYKVVGEEQGKYRLAFADQRGDGVTYCDFVPDFWLARREIFDKVQMDPNLKPAQGGHENFFADIYKLRSEGEIDWRVGYTNEVIALHEKGEQSDEYKQHRSSGIADYHRNIRVIRPGHERQDTKN